MHADSSSTRASFVWAWLNVCTRAVPCSLMLMQALSTDSLGCLPDSGYPHPIRALITSKGAMVHGPNRRRFQGWVYHRPCAMRTLMTSKGPVAQGPMQAALKPESMDCQGCSWRPSPSILPKNIRSKLFLAQNRHI